MLLVGARLLPWLLERVAGADSRELFTFAVVAAAIGIGFGAAELHRQRRRQEQRRVRTLWWVNPTTVTARLWSCTRFKMLSASGFKG